MPPVTDAQLDELAQSAIPILDKLADYFEAGETRPRCWTPACDRLAIFTGLYTVPHRSDPDRRRRLELDLCRTHAEAAALAYADDQLTVGGHTVVRFEAVAR